LKLVRLIMKKTSEFCLQTGKGDSIRIDCD